MTKKLTEAVKKQKKSTLQTQLQITGTLGIPLGGQKLVDVPNRNSFVYVKLRDNQSEVIQAFNNKVAPSYNLPVIVERQGGRYVVLGVDTLRYQNNWSSFSPYLPRHGNVHSFNTETGGGGDIVWVYSQQFMPALVIPSGTLGGPNVLMSAYTLKNADGSWKHVGNTGTASLLPYKPATGTQAVMALVYLDSISGNPYFIVGSGSYFPASITGTSQVMPYVPSLSNPNLIPLAAVRLVTGTSNILWNNIYDVRQFIHTTPTGSGGSSGIEVQDEGVSLGTFQTLNFKGDLVNVQAAGSIADINITGTTGGTTNITGTSVGDPNRIVGTTSSGFLQALPWLLHGFIGSQGFLEFEPSAVKEANAGRIGYQLFDSYFDIIGAGTVAGQRTVQIYDNLRVSENTRSSSISINNLNSQLIATNETGTFVSGEPPYNSGTYGRKDGGWVPVTPEDGWIFCEETWTRTGNFTFTISGDVTTKYRRWTKVKYNDPSLEYGVILSSSHATGTTTITLVSNSDYAMAAATITGRYISYIENPEGFPITFGYAPNLTNMSIGNGVQSCRWEVSRGLFYFNYGLVFGSTSSVSGNVSIGIPVTAQGFASSEIVGISRYLDSSAPAAYQGGIQLTATRDGIRPIVYGAAGTYATSVTLSSTVPMTWAADDEISLSCWVFVEE